jgi:hypothetical protein
MAKRAPYVPPEILETEFYVLVNESQARALMAGVVPDTVQQMVRAMVEWKLEDMATWHPEERRGTYESAALRAGKLF